MPENFKQFDFSKPEDQEKFEALDQGKKKEIAETSEKEAYAVNDLIKKGKAKNYEEAMQVAKQELITCLNNGDINDALEIKNKLKLPKEIINSPEVQEAVKQVLISCFSIKNDKIYYALRIRDEFYLPKKIIESPEIQEAAIQGFINNVNGVCFDADVEIKNKFFLPENIVQEVVKQKLVYYFTGCLHSEIEFASRLVNKFSLPENIVQEVAGQCLAYHLERGNFSDAIKIKKGLKLSKEVIESSEIQKAAKQRFIDTLTKNLIDDALKIKTEFNLPEEVVQEVVKKEFIYQLNKDNVNEALEIKKILNLPEEIVQEVTRQELVSTLRKGYVGQAIKIKNKFNLSEEFLSSPEVQEAIKQGLIFHISNGYNYQVREIKDKFVLSEEILQEATKQGLVSCLINGRIDNVLKIKDAKEIMSSPEVQSAAKQGLVNCLIDGRIYDVLKIKDALNLSKEIMSSPEVQSAAKQGIIYRLNKCDIESALKIKEEIGVFISSQEIIQQIPALNYLINKISELGPEFRTQVEKSSDLAIELCQFINNPEQLINVIKENPHLIDTLSGNSRFSSRLLIKYPQFDKNSKENIGKLYSAKKKIMAANPEMDPESLEFRQLMQEELKEFKNNPEIIAEIERQGINLNEWLNHSETEYFNLSTGGAEIALSEKIRTPIDRIKETIDSYAYTVKSALKEYRPEMEKFEIVLEDAKPVEQQITKMEAALEQARAEGNEKKAQGIERGLASQKEKLNNLKKGFLWDKLMGDIAAFQRLKNDCFDAQKRLMEAENKLNKTLSGKMPSGKEIQDIKQKMSKAKEELRDKFGDLDNRIEEFKARLWTTISPCLGDDRTGAIIEEVRTNLAEQFDHYNDDRSTLANLFSEKSNSEKEKMESRPMSIFVWSRNPDIDLYQGNYSPCCICIDSAHMGAECTIADYSTDLGVQIVNIWDETKNEPVTAAWCWLGENENKEKALVIDNIESNTLFSSNFSEQLSDELFDYIKTYARKIGVDKVVMGKANNDLPTASRLSGLREDSGQYEKIGGSNRSDGYFLEAQEKSVKIVWDKKEDKPIKKSKTEKSKTKPTIKYENIAGANLTPKDFDKIKKLEAKIYKDTGLAQGAGLIEDIKSSNGLEYSIIMEGKNPKHEQVETIGYLVAVEDKTDEGDPSIYMEDIAVLPEAQSQSVGWELLKSLVSKLKAKAEKDGQPVLLDMNLREGSQALMRKHKDDLENMGVKLIEEALVADYYNEGEDALYQVYEVK